MARAAIQRMVVAYRNVNKPEGIQAYTLDDGNTDRPIEQIDCTWEDGRVRIVYKASIDDYHVQTLVGYWTILQPNKIDARIKEIAEQAKRQLPVLSKPEDF